MDSNKLPSQLNPQPIAFMWLVVIFAATFTGCTLCQDCGDLDYPTYGGAWQRTRRDSGRVGSIFDPAGARTATLSDRDSDSEDPSTISPKAQTGPGVDDQAAPSDDPKELDADGDKPPSPSDRSPKGDKLRDLDLEDINVESDDLLPPDV